jgi:poly-gamma-glutamate synthesis protein (capsule biosynthesis protein)
VIFIKKRKLKTWPKLFLGCIIGLLLSYITLGLDDGNYKNDNIIKAQPKKREYNLDLIMVGDALIHSPVYTDAYIGNNQYDFTKMLTYIKPIVQNYDLAFYNQETIIGGKELGLSTYPRFNSPEEIGDAMIATGFNLVSLANNHTLDRGTNAIVHSLNYWGTKNVMTAGSYLDNEHRQKIDIKTKNNISYTLLSYTTTTNCLKIPAGKEYYVNAYDKEKVKEDIERVRDKVDVLMVSMHWGNEYSRTPSSEQKEIAQYLSSLGVDIIIGHHPHVIEPIEIMGNTLVIYSLGNFISAQEKNKMDRMVGMMVSVNIKKTIEGDNISFSYDDITANLIYTYRNRQNKNFKVIPFANLTNDFLPNYEKYYTTYSSIIKNYDDSIMVAK